MTNMKRNCFVVIVNPWFVCAFRFPDAMYGLQPVTSFDVSLPSPTMMGS